LFCRNFFISSTKVLWNYNSWRQLLTFAACPWQVNSTDGCSRQTIDQYALNWNFTVTLTSDLLISKYNHFIFIPICTLVVNLVKFPCTWFVRYYAIELDHAQMYRWTGTTVKHYTFGGYLPAKVWRIANKELAEWNQLCPIQAFTHAQDRSTQTLYLLPACQLSWAIDWARFNVPPNTL